jgi:hypothetical protein
MGELKWQPLCDVSSGLAVRDGVVTLPGIVDVYRKKVTAEPAVVAPDGELDREFQWEAAGWQ